MYLYIWTPHVCLVPAVVREDPGSSESVVTNGCQCCKLSPGPRPVFLTSEASLQPGMCLKGSPCTAPVLSLPRLERAWLNCSWLLLVPTLSWGLTQQLPPSH